MPNISFTKGKRQARLTIPKETIDFQGWKSGTKVIFVNLEKGQVLIKEVR